MVENGGTLSFFESRLSAVDSNHSTGIAPAAEMLAAQGWPELHHREGPDNTGYEFKSRLLTGSNGLNWLVVAGQSFSCASGSIWNSAHGQCERCEIGTVPSGRECRPCGETEHATADGCAACADGTQPDPRRVACVPCPAGFAGTAGQCSECGPDLTPDEDGAGCVDTELAAEAKIAIGCVVALFVGGLVGGLVGSSGKRKAVEQLQEHIKELESPVAQADPQVDGTPRPQAEEGSPPATAPLVSPAHGTV